MSSNIMAICGRDKGVEAVERLYKAQMYTPGIAQE